MIKSAQNVCDLLNDPVYLELSAAQQLSLPAAHDFAALYTQSPQVLQMGPRSNWRKQLKYVLIHSQNSGHSQYTLSVLIPAVEEHWFQSSENLQTSAFLFKTTVLIYFDKTITLPF